MGLLPKDWMKIKICKTNYALAALLTFTLVLTFIFVQDFLCVYAAENANAEYSLEGAVYQVYTDQGCTKKATTTNGANAVFTTDANGDAAEIEMSEGTYYVKENEASKGYILDKQVYTVEVKAGETKWVNSELKHVSEIPQSLELGIQKVNIDGKPAATYGTTLEGAQFEIVYSDGAGTNRTWIVKTDKSGKANLDDDHFVSGDERYQNSEKKYVVPLGTVTIKEVKAPSGYKKSDEIQTLKIRWDGASAEKENTNNVTFTTQGSANDKASMYADGTTTFPDQPQSAQIKLCKIDKETGKSVPLGAASLEGASFMIKCNEGEDAGKSWNIQTDAEGIATLDSLVNDGSSEIYKNKEGKPALRLGKYTISETKASLGYIVNEGTVDLQIAGDDSGTETTGNVTASDNKSGAEITGSDPIELTWPEPVVRGDLSFLKVDKGKMHPIKNVAFVIRSKTTGESHVIVTDNNGNISTNSKEGNPHSQNTNANDAVIDAEGNPALNDQGEIDSSKLSYKNGIWFYKDKNGNESKEVSDNKGALPYDEYLVTELPSEANRGRKMIVQREVHIDRNEQIVFGGTWINDAEEGNYKMYKVRNEEAPSDGNGKFGFEPGDYVTYDIVIENPNKGTLTMDVKDEFTEGAENFSKPVVIGVKNAKQNKRSLDKGKVNITIEPKQTATVTFGALVKTGAVEYLADNAKDSDSKNNEGKDCNIDEQDNTTDDADGYMNYASTSKVVYKPSAAELPKQTLQDKDDPAQTPVKVPKIATYLADEANRKVVSGSSAAIVDTVKYEGFTPGKTYVIEGILMVKDTAEPLTENGKKVKAVSGEFVPDKPNGEAKVKFKLDCGNVQGKALVAFETAYVVKDKAGNKPKDKNGKDTSKLEVARHENISDPDQTVEVPGYKMYKIRTKDAEAVGKKYGFDVGSTVTYDVVIENISESCSIRMDITDHFSEHPEYFTMPKVVNVIDATELDRSEDGNKISVLVDAGKTAVVSYEAKVKSDAKAYLAKNAADSDSKDKDGNDVNKKYQQNKTDDKDGYRNIAEVIDPVPEIPNPDKPEESIVLEPLPNDEDEAQTPVKVKGNSPDTGDENALIYCLTGFFAAALAFVLVLIRRRTEKDHDYIR